MRKNCEAAIVPTGEQMVNYGTTVVILFPGPRNVISTSWLNGGYRSDLTAVFNHQISTEACDACHNGGSIQDYLVRVASSHGLDPVAVSGLVTRAEMKNTAIVSEIFRDLSVTAIVTAGIDKNGGRAGDPASYYENGDTFEPVGGTINTVLIIGADLPEYAMARALVTATEAKSATLQQLMARSLYSEGIATGSGTDMTAIVTDPGSLLHLSDAGKHAKLGELIGKTVMRATTTALEMETGLSAASQRDAMVRLSRFGITADDIWREARDSGLLPVDGSIMREQFLSCVTDWAGSSVNVARVSAALHMLDEESWGLLSQDSVCPVLSSLFLETGHLSRDTRMPSSRVIVSLAARSAAAGFRAWQEGARQPDTFPTGPGS